MGVGESDPPYCPVLEAQEGLQGGICFAQSRFGALEVI